LAIIVVLITAVLWAESRHQRLTRLPNDFATMVGEAIEMIEERKE